MWKRINPEHTGIDHLDDESRWHLLERQRIVNASNTFLDCTNVTLNLRNVFVGRHGVHVDFDVGKVGSEGFKLTIH